jgi:hypothetical protein
MRALPIGIVKNDSTGSFLKSSSNWLFMAYSLLFKKAVQPGIIFNLREKNY